MGLLPFKVFACVGWLASNLGEYVILGYALTLIVLTIGGIVQRLCGRRADSLITFAAAVWSLILWKLLPMLAK